MSLSILNDSGCDDFSADSPPEMAGVFLRSIFLKPMMMMMMMMMMMTMMMG